MMKKILTFTMLVLLAMTTLYAQDPINAPIDRNVVLKSKVAGGSGIGDPEDPQTPVIVGSMGIYLVLVQGEEPQSWSFDGSVTDLVAQTGDTEINVDFTDPAVASSFYIAIGAKANATASNSATVTLSSQGWKRGNDFVGSNTTTDPTLTIETEAKTVSGFTNETTGSKSASNGSSTISVGVKTQANAGTNNTSEDPALVGVATVSWTQSAKFSAGDYEAIITVNVAAA